MKTKLYKTICVQKQYMLKVCKFQCTPVKLSCLEHQEKNIAYNLKNRTLFLVPNTKCISFRKQPQSLGQL